MQYRRANVTGGTYFFTVNLANRKNTLLIDEFDKLRIIINKVKKQHPFKLDALVILPDHLHAIWTLPVHDNDFAKRWMLIKAGFSRYVPNHEKINDSRKKKGERGIWQRRYWEHLIRDEDGYEKHVKGTSINCLCPLALRPVQNQDVLLKPYLLYVEKAQRRVWTGRKAPQGMT